MYHDVVEQNASRTAILKLELVSKSPEGLIKIQVVGGT